MLVSSRAQRRSDIDEVAKPLVVVTVEGEMYCRRFTIDIDANASTKGDGGKLFRRGKMQQVELDTELTGQRDHFQHRCQHHRCIARLCPRGGIMPAQYITV